MERAEYLRMARHCAMLEKDSRGIPLNVPSRYRVVWQGLEFYPVSLHISFGPDGSVINHCVFHDLHADSIAGADLEYVQSKGE